MKKKSEYTTIKIRYRRYDPHKQEYKTHTGTRKINKKNLSKYYTDTRIINKKPTKIKIKYERQGIIEEFGTKYKRKTIKTPRLVANNKGQTTKSLSKIKEQLRKEVKNKKNKGKRMRIIVELETKGKKPKKLTISSEHLKRNQKSLDCGMDEIEGKLRKVTGGEYDFFKKNKNYKIKRATIIIGE